MNVFVFVFVFSFFILYLLLGGLLFCGGRGYCYVNMGLILLYKPLSHILAEVFLYTVYEIKTWIVARYFKIFVVDQKFILNGWLVGFWVGQPFLGYLIPG